MLNVVIIESMSPSSLFMMVRGANFPSITAWRVSNTLGSSSFSRSNLSLQGFSLLILFKKETKKAKTEQEEKERKEEENYRFVDQGYNRNGVYYR